MEPSTLQALTLRIKDFRDQRDWSRFHNPKDTALSLSLEAAEVLELFQWKDAEHRPDPDRLGEELSDVLYWVLLMASDAGIDLADAFEKKMQQNEAKYPIGKASGSAAKYTEL